MNPFQALLNDYHQDREKQEHEQFIEEERRRHGQDYYHLKQSRGTMEWRPFLVAPRRASAGAGARFPDRSSSYAATAMVSGGYEGERRLPVFSFDAIHRPFCVTPSPRQTPPDGPDKLWWTPQPSWISPAYVGTAAPLQAWTLPGSPAANLASSSTPAPARPLRLVLPSLSPAPAPPILPALVDDEPAASATPAVAVISGSIEPTLTVEKAEESADALLSLVTLSCASPTASPRQQSRRLQLTSASEKLAELTMRKRKRDAADEPSGQAENKDGDSNNDDDGEELEQQFCHRRRRSTSAQRNKRRRVEPNVDACHHRPMDQVLAGDQASEMAHAEQHETQQAIVEAESDVEECSQENDDHRQQQLLLGEESANEDEADESRRRPDQKMVMETTEDEEEQETGCRGRRRIWGSISARELASLQWHQPLPGRRQTRVARLGLDRLSVRPHA